MIKNCCPAGKIISIKKPCPTKPKVINRFPICPCPPIIPCTSPSITLLPLPKTVICGGAITGTVTCNGLPIAGVNVTLSSSSGVVSFISNPVHTDASGVFTAPFIIAPGTSPTPVTITALTVINGIVTSSSVAITVSCPGGGGTACGCRLSNQAGNPINITRGSQDVVFNGAGANGMINFFGAICPTCTTASSFFTFTFRDTPPVTATSFTFDIDPTTIETTCTGTQLKVTGLGTASPAVFGPNPVSFTLTATRPGAPNNTIAIIIGDPATTGFSTTAFNVGNGELVITPCPQP
ncbi:hypothetical protein JQN58_18895 [Aneurinibacillus sp. BA2021]|nr:hypothetical protein [Aneurinibacillus sp. BA2021]